MASTDKDKKFEAIDSAVFKKESKKRLDALKIPPNINYVLNRIRNLKTKIKAENPLVLSLKKDKELMNYINDPLVIKIADYFDYSFKIDNAIALQEEISNCLIILQQVYDKASRSGSNLITFEKEYQFNIARGALKKLHYSINFVSNRILTKTDNPIELNKYFSALETALTSLAPLEEYVQTDPLQITKTNFEQLAPSDQKLFAIAIFQPIFVMELEKNDKQKIFSYLLGDKEVEERVSIVPTELAQLFKDYNSEKRKEFVEILAKFLTPDEKMMLSQM
jgi:hypothetical protein